MLKEGVDVSAAIAEVRKPNLGKCRQQAFSDRDRGVSRRMDTKMSTLETFETFET